MKFLEKLLRRKIGEGHTYTDEYGNRWLKDLSNADDKTWQRVLSRWENKHPSAIEYLERYGESYPWQRAWLTYGELYPSPSQDFCDQLEKQKGLMKKGDCYLNALRLALGMEGEIFTPEPPKKILYAEGLAVHPTGAHLHAWLVVDGFVYDPTWPDSYRASYFGISFDPEKMFIFAEETNWVSLLQNWEISQRYLESLLQKE